MQTISHEQADKFIYSVNDQAKVSPHDPLPPEEFSGIVLHVNLVYFAEVVRIALLPSHLISGISSPNDLVLELTYICIPTLTNTVYQLATTNDCPPTVQANGSGCFFDDIWSDDDGAFTNRREKQILLDQFQISMSMMVIGTTTLMNFLQCKFRLLAQLLMSPK